MSTIADQLRSLTPEQRNAILDSLTEDEVQAFQYDWYGVWSRPSQRPPDGDWKTWALVSGRGAGKSRTGAEWIRHEAMSRRIRIAIVAPTAAAARDVCIEGESGLLNIGPPSERPWYEPSKRRLTWKNGSLATLFSAEEPESLRGPQFHVFWADELAAWQYDQETWDMLQFGMRLGKQPCGVVTTTPKPTALIKSILADPLTARTTESTYANAANLAPTYLKDILSRYEGTRLGRQEIHAELLEDVQGALWNNAMIDACRIDPAKLPDLVRIVVAIDPAVTNTSDSDETGIVVVGVDAEKRGFVLEDLSGRYSPHQWASKAIDAFERHNADRIVAESNQGGEMVSAIIRQINPNVPVKRVHASKGKVTRAEPIAALYEQNRVFHAGSFPLLEPQMTAFVPGDLKSSPDRVDALVWALTETMLKARTPFEREIVKP